MTTGYAKYYGLNACRAVFEQRPEDILKVHLSEARVKDFSKLLKFCAANKLSYTISSPVQLEKISGSKHHEGISLLATAPLPLSWSNCGKQILELAEPLVLLDGVENPHNLGAILRTCGFLGVAVVLVSAKGPLSVSAACARVAEGAAEILQVVRIEDISVCLKDLQNSGFKIYATKSAAEKSYFAEQFPLRSVFVFGAEDKGLSEAATRFCTEEIAIPSASSASSTVDSLNVSVAVGVILSEFARQQISKTASSR